MEGGEPPPKKSRLTRASEAQGRMAPSTPTLDVRICSTASSSESVLIVRLAQSADDLAHSWIVQWSWSGWWRWSSRERVQLQTSSSTESPWNPGTTRGFLRLAVPTKGAERLRVRAHAVNSSGITGAWSVEVTALPVGPPVKVVLKTVRQNFADGPRDEHEHVVVELSPVDCMEGRMQAVQRIVATGELPAMEGIQHEGGAVLSQVGIVPNELVGAVQGGGGDECDHDESGGGGGGGDKEHTKVVVTAPTMVGSTLRTLGVAVRGTVAQLAGSATERTIDSALALSNAALNGGRRDVLLERDQAVVKPSLPPFAHVSECAGCLFSGAESASFGILRHKHHCRHCGQSFCADHLRWRYRMPKFAGGDTPQRVCWSCVLQLRREEFENRNAERVCRISDFLGGHLQPFVTLMEDTVAAKARRVGRFHALPMTPAPSAPPPECCCMRPAT